MSALYPNTSCAIRDRLYEASMNLRSKRNPVEAPHGGMHKYESEDATGKCLLFGAMFA